MSSCAYANKTWLYGYVKGNVFTNRLPSKLVFNGMLYRGHRETLRHATLSKRR